MITVTSHQSQDSLCRASQFRNGSASQALCRVLSGVRYRASIIAAAASLAGCGSSLSQQRNSKATQAQATLPRFASNLPANLESTSLPASMAIFGDSIAVGMFADTVNGGELTGDQRGRFMAAQSLMSSLPADAPELVQKLQELGEAPKYSAWSGEAAWSHKKRIEALTGKSLVVHRFAIQGSDSESLGAQIFEAREFYAKRNKSPADYVVLVVGGNDFCNNRPLEQFRGNLQFRLYQLLKTHPTSKVIVTHVPDVVSVMTLPEAKAFSIYGHNVTCSQIRSIAQLCQASGLSSGSTSAEKDSGRARIAAMNAIIDEQVGWQRDGRGSFPRYAGRISSAPLPQGPYTVDHSILAADCFHPNAQGQQLFAEYTWAAAKSLFGLP